MTTTTTWAAAVLIGAAALAARAQDQNIPTTTAEPARRPQPVKPTAPVAPPPPVATKVEVRDAFDDYYFSARSPQAPTKAAYLGVNTSPAQPALQKQLQLKPGIGLVVDAIEPGSPASQAGVREYDVLHKLDEQILINAEQFAVLVRTYDPGAEVRLNVIREGKPVALTAKLVEREVPPLRLSFTNQNTFSIQSDPLVYYGSTLTPATTAAPDAAQKAVTFLDANANDLLVLTTPDGKQKLSAAQVTVEDDAHRVTISNRDGRKHVKVTEKQSGKVTFDGPVDDVAKLDKIPQSLLLACREILLDKPAATSTTAPAAGSAPPSLPAPASKDLAPLPTTK